MTIHFDQQNASIKNLKMIDMIAYTTLASHKIYLNQLNYSLVDGWMDRWDTNSSFLFRCIAEA